MTRQLKPFLLLITVSLAAAAFCYFFLFHLPFGPGKQDFTKNLNGGYKLYRMSSNNIFIAPGDVWNEAAIVPEKVIRIAEYKSYIIAERQLLSRFSPYDGSNTGHGTDSIATNYWILNTQEHSMIKNLNSRQLTIALDSLDIPANITLTDVYKY